MPAIQIPTLDEIRLVVREEIARAQRESSAANDPYVTVAQAARALGVSERTIRRRAQSNEIPAIRVGRAVRVSVAAVTPAPDAVARAARVALVGGGG
jgi:excisionase family DNA binding protein